MMPIDLQCSFLVGSMMAFISGRRLPMATPTWLARARILALIFGGIVFTPVWIYITLRWTPWESMYVWDLSSVPFSLVALFPPGLSLAALLGFNTTARLLSTRRVISSVGINLLVLASCVAVVVPGWERFTFVGTLEEFAAGMRGNLLKSDLALFVIAVTVLFFAPAAVLIVRALRREDDA
jgi:hypothetical protein